MSLRRAVLCVMLGLEATRGDSSMCTCMWRTACLCVFQKWMNACRMFTPMTQYGMTYKSSAIWLPDLVVTVLCVTSLDPKMSNLKQGGSIAQWIHWSIFPPYLIWLWRPDIITTLALTSNFRLKRLDFERRASHTGLVIVAFSVGDNCNCINIASLRVLQGVFVLLHR